MDIGNVLSERASPASAHPQTQGKPLDCHIPHSHLSKNLTVPCQYAQSLHSRQ